MCVCVTHLLPEVVQFEKSGPALNLCLNESGRSHFYIASTEVMVTKTGKREEEKIMTDGN